MKLHFICVLEFLFLLIFVHSISMVIPEKLNAQTNNNQCYLTDEEKNQINIKLFSTTFGYSYLADSFAKLGDSIKSSFWIEKINPYELLYEGVTPDSIDIYLLRRFIATKSVREKYALNYNKIYKNKKSIAYYKFKEMFEDDQAIRKLYDLGGDSSTRAELRSRSAKADSIHFDYLYKYVEKNGWPTIANGSLFASIISIHDHEHHSYYFPFIKKAVLIGEDDELILKVMLAWQDYEHDYDEFQNCLEQNSYVSFNVSSMFNHQLPDSLIEIENAVSKYCPSRVVFILRAKDINTYMEWKDKVMQPWVGYHDDYTRSHNILSKLEIDLVHYMTCPIYDRRILNERFSFREGIPCFPRWQLTDNDNPQLILYITFCINDTSNYDFTQLYTANKIITHNIHFDVNQSIIKQVSMNYIKQLADWLNIHQRVKLEIDGNTDNDGIPSANLKLSQARADEVKKQLVALGISTTRLTTKGYGDTKPIQSNSTQEGKAANRRVEFIKQ